MQPIIVIMNFGYAIGGGLITLIFMYFGYNKKLKNILSQFRFIMILYDSIN